MDRYLFGCLPRTSKCLAVWLQWIYPNQTVAVSGCNIWGGPRSFFHCVKMFSYGGLFKMKHKLITKIVTICSYDFLPPCHQFINSLFFVKILIFGCKKQDTHTTYSTALTSMNTLPWRWLSKQTERQRQREMDDSPWERCWVDGLYSPKPYLWSCFWWRWSCIIL